MPAPTSRAVPVVFLHGFAGQGRGLRRLADLYAGTEAVCLDLPGFGGTAPPPMNDTRSMDEYCTAVWQRIRRLVPAGPVTLIGHSHGAMVGYVLAVRHPDEIAGLELFCPVARPRLIPRLFIRSLLLARALGIPATVLIRLLSHPAAVALVSRYTADRHWSAPERAHIDQMRRDEARFYSPIMFDLMGQTLSFKKVMDDSRCLVPTRIHVASHDNVAGAEDHSWYAHRATSAEVHEFTGGHLAVVADPARVVTRLARGEARSCM
ncbi:MAG TPA: alpha/beta fold hydrolase [Actinoplanes sp.]|nr:alpha/beta fold hydrolase [Actinoplanes sp.]